MKKIPEKFQTIIDEIQDQYHFSDESNRPWIIGFSGGKDSTVLLTLVWMALSKLKETIPGFNFKRDVYVVCNDTLVENPVITDYVDDVLIYVERAAVDQGLPIFVKKTTPKIEETFWINVIGKGYPLPNSTFRWCTDRLKIRPTSSFLRGQIDEKGEAVVLLGTRYSESRTRERSIRKHESKSKRLSAHPQYPNAMTFSPIKTLELEEVWYLINAFESPWGFDNSMLFKIYSDASADDYECPTVVTTKEHTSCGQSRFGCWTCTVVKKDKSMSALINNGQEWLYPLLKLRNDLQEERNISKNRSGKRRNGQLAINEDGMNQGNYTPEYRYSVLKRLLEAQKKVQQEKPELNLITHQELIAIQVLWNRDLFFEKNVSELYKEIYGKNAVAKSLRGIGPLEKRVLTEECGDDDNMKIMIENLLSVQETKSLLISNRGLNNDLEKVIESQISIKQ